jgi:tRNA(fMet)-specific endonuclease VapC
VGVATIRRAEIADGETSMTAANDLASLLPVLPLPVDAGRSYGALRAELEASGRVIGNNDLWIAAHAKAAKLILVTNNEREFQRVSGLEIQNWAKSEGPKPR